MAKEPVTRMTHANAISTQRNYLISRHLDFASIHLKPKYSHYNSSLSNLKFCKVTIQYVVVISKWKIECWLSYYYNYFKNGPNFKSDIYFCYQALACSPKNRVWVIVVTTFHAHALWLLLYTLIVVCTYVIIVTPSCGHVVRDFESEAKTRYNF